MSDDAAPALGYDPEKIVIVSTSSPTGFYFRPPHELVEGESFELTFSSFPSFFSFSSTVPRPD